MLCFVLQQLQHYWDKSPDTAKAAIDAIAGKEAGSQRDVPRAYVAPPPEWLEQLGVPAVQGVKAKALAALQGCGSKGAKAKGLRLVVSALGCFEELAGVLLQDLPLRIDVTGAWLKSNAVPPIPGQESTALVDIDIVD